MTISRTRFRVESVTATPTVINIKGDTGRLYGELKQISWSPDVADTGTPAAVQIALCPDNADTGKGFFIYSATQQMGVGWDTGQPKITGYIGANDRLRLKVRPTDTGNVIRGDLYVWSGGV